MSISFQSRNLSLDEFKQELINANRVEELAFTEDFKELLVPEAAIKCSNHQCQVGKNWRNKSLVELFSI